MKRNKLLKIKKEKRGLKTHKKIREIAKLSNRPRLSVYRSNKYIYAQIIDDKKGKTIVSASSLNLKSKKTKKEKAYEVGKTLAERAVAAGIKKVVFDKGKYKYHGRVKALADGAREGGLIF
jgi:large subunit ribosomal protein L18